MKKMPEKSIFDLRYPYDKKFPCGVLYCQTINRLRHICPKGWMILLSSSSTDDLVRVIPYECKPDGPIRLGLYDVEYNLVGGFVPTFTYTEALPDHVKEMTDAIQAHEHPLFVMPEKDGLTPEQVTKTIVEYTHVSREEYQRFEAFIKLHEDAYVQALEETGLTYFQAKDHFTKFYTDRHHSNRNEVGYQFHQALNELQTMNEFNKKLKRVE